MGGPHRRRGYPTISKTLERKKDAQDWADQQEGRMVEGTFVDRRPAERTTLKDVLQRYLVPCSADRRPRQRRHMRQAAR
jgi:hypothetical protein